MVAETFWEVIRLPILAGLSLSFAVEALVRPGVALPWRRPLPALALHTALWLLVFLVEMAQFQRPWFAAAVALALLTILVLVNNAKVQALREPFIGQDFEYFLDTIRYPRLYLPFFGIGKAIGAAMAVMLAIGLGLVLERPLTASLALTAFLSGFATLGLVAVGLLLWALRAGLPLSFSPEQDIHALGFLASLVPYLRAERRCPELPTPFYTDRTRPAGETLPHLVLVQSESFFDPRPWYPALRPDLLARFDALKRSAHWHGRLEVPAWGANTVRTEFAFLSGLSPAQLGVHRFNPYRKFARHSPHTLVGLARQMGYRTLCIHPYPAGFYGRSKIFPGLGFDRFMDIKSFDEQGKSGPYIGDVALAEKIRTELAAASKQPLLVFAITMENHGPLHWEQARPGEDRQYSTEPFPQGCEDLTIYLRHLANADRMAGMLDTALNALDRPAWLCWYGDHVPILPEVYKQLGAPDGCTEYLIWSNSGRATGPQRRDQRVEDLGLVLLAEAGLISPADSPPAACRPQGMNGNICRTMRWTD